MSTTVRAGGSAASPQSSSVASPLSGSGSSGSVAVPVGRDGGLRTPLVYSQGALAGGVEDWDGKGTWGKPARSLCSGPDGTEYRCLDLRPSTEAGWTAMLWGNVVAYVAMLLINYLVGVSGVLNGAGGTTVSGISSIYKTAVTPAGWAFSIWGVIFTLVGFFVVAQALDRELRVASTVPFLWLMTGVSIWIFCWCFQQMALSAIVMLTSVLTPLIVLYHTIGEAAVNRAHTALGALSTRVMTSAFLGWITVATILNIASAGTPKNGIGGGDWGPSNYARVMITVALALACLMLFLHADVAFTAVLIWAFMAIADNQGSGSGYPGDDRIPTLARTYAFILIGLSLVFVLPRCNWRK